MRRRIFSFHLAVILGCFCSIPLFAQTVINLQADKGHVEFHAKAIGMKVIGHGDVVKGQFQLQDHRVTGLASFDLSVLSTDNSLRDDHMKNKYLEVKKHPLATLTISHLVLPKGLEGLSSDKLDFTGMLALRGKAKETSGTITIVKKDKAYEIEANFHLKMSDFGIPRPFYEEVTVADEVEVTVKSLATVSP
jgi:polyisoprenoid-binding protein YceI